jgi:thiol:disulfide interchange protein DsbD
MKKLMVLFFLIIGVFVYADEINWVYSLDEALELSKKESKPIMVDIYADWCGWCTKLDQEIYTDESVIETSKEFINLKIDSENNLVDFDRINDAFEIDSLPTILFLDGEFNYISELNGYVEVDYLVEEMLYVLLFDVFSEHAFEDSESESINWTSDLLTALETANKENKIIMIDIYADWCEWCKKLDEETYKDLEVIELSKKFVNLKVDTDNNLLEFQALNGVFGITGIPVILFINSDGELIHRIDGYVDAETFKTQVREIKITEEKNKVIEEGIKWENDLESAFILANSENKIIMVDVYADWCGWCKRLDEDTYSNSEIIELSKNLINLKIDSDNNKSDFDLLNKEFEITGLPAILFMDKDGNLIHRINGYVDAETFKKELKKIDSFSKIIMF